MFTGTLIIRTKSRKCQKKWVVVTDSQTPESVFINSRKQVDQIEFKTH